MRSLQVGVVVLLMVAASGLPGCAPAPSEPSTAVGDAITIHPTPDSAPASPVSRPTVALSERNLAAFRAILTAEREVGGSAIEIDSDYKRWEVDVLVDWTEHELDISTDGDTVLRNENSDADTDDFRRLAAVTHSMAEATMVALENTPGDVAEVSLQTTNGTVIWDVTIEQESGGFAYVGINAGTGEVIR